MRRLARRCVILAVLGVFMVFVAHPQTGGKAHQSHEMIVTGVGDTRVVSMDLTIVNEFGEKLAMPSCGQLIDEYVVCLPPAFVEQYDGTAWQRAKEKGDHMYGELAAPPLAIIEPGGSIRVHAGFPFDSYEWQPDQPVRLGYSGVACIRNQENTRESRSICHNSTAASERGGIGI